MSTVESTAELYENYLVPLATPCVAYYPSLFDPASAADLYDELHKSVPWTKTAKINRWVALYENEPDNDYKYRDAPAGGSLPMTDTIRRVQQRVEDCYHRLTGTRVSFNTCLANFYENGHQRIGWHADREEIGRTTPIASVSLGAVRQFLVRHKAQGLTDRAAMDLASGSVVFMENVCQREYLHAIPKQTEVTSGRINLTFRCKTAETPGEEEHQRRDNWLENIAQDIMESDTKDGEHHAATLFGHGIQTEFSDPHAPNVCYTVSCNIGTENQVAAEVIEVLDDPVGWEVVSTPFGIVGYVAICANPDMKTPEIVAKLLELRSVVNVMEYHDHFELQQVAPEIPISKIDGEALYQFYKKRLEANPDLITSLAAASAENLRTFRVTCDRIGGPHAFQAPNVEFEVGGAMSEFYEYCKPKMTDHDVHCRVDVVSDKVVVGTQLNVEDLSKRHFLRHRNAVTIKTNVAYIMLRLANVKKGSTLVDPFCGSGTILLEALEMTQSNVRCIGMDVSRRTASGAAENAVAEGYGPDLCSIHTCDARGLRRHVEDESADAMVSNLPWGVRTGHKQGVKDLQQTYEVFLRTAWYTLRPGARIVMLVLRGLQMIRILRKLGGRYRILSVMIVRTTNNLPAIIVVEKVGKDVIRDSLKGQLSRFSKYVNVSAELYHAINYEDIDEAN